MGMHVVRTRYQRWICLLGLVPAASTLLLCCDRFVAQAALSSKDQYVCKKHGDGECPDPDDYNGDCPHSDRRLTPSDLPPPRIFDGFDGNTTLTVSGRELTALHGSILQQGGNANARDDAGGNGSDFSSELVVIPGLIPRDVVAELLTLLRGDEDADRAGGKTTVALDRDPDSVDGMTSQEIFLDNDSLREGKPSKGGVGENMEERRDLRKKLRGLTDAYSRGFLMPFLREWYGTEKCGRAGRGCTPCYSLIRRYRAGERQSHAPHNDGHSFVTVVVSLADYGDEYNGGLYVSTKSSERSYIKLNRGDAVAHQADLNHGVRVLDQRDDGGPSERWSWIMWFRDSDTCDDHADEWHRKCSDQGNPTCVYLRSKTQSNQDDIIYWVKKASDAGHAIASVKLAYAYLKRLPSPLEYNQTRAQELFETAIWQSNEPDGHYGMATLYLAHTRAKIMEQPSDERKQQAAIAMMGSPVMMTAICHLEEAAKGGHVFAMFNLGICYTYGYGRRDGVKDFELAARWFESSGLPEGLFAKSLYLGSVGREEESWAFQEKAATLGFGTPWRQVARERTGSGESPGPQLNLMWPPRPGGESPPQW